MPKNFIQDAIKKPGALRSSAKAKGLIKGNQKLSGGDLNKLADSTDKKTQQRANFAKTLAKLRKK